MTYQIIDVTDYGSRVRSKFSTDRRMDRDNREIGIRIRRKQHTWCVHGIAIAKRYTKQVQLFTDETRSGEWYDSDIEKERKREKWWDKKGMMLESKRYFYSINVDWYSAVIFVGCLWKQRRATSKSIEAFLTHGHLSIPWRWHTEQIVLRVWFRFETRFRWIACPKYIIRIYTQNYTYTLQSSVDKCSDYFTRSDICLIKRSAFSLCNRFIYIL